MKSDTVIVCPDTVNEPMELGLTVKQVTAGEQFEVLGVRFEAVSAYNIGKPFRPAIPIHYGTVAGSPADGEKFRKAVDNGIEVVLKM